ncbi:hypothetical protein V8E36_000216 [Tilletia maclaganii]
MELVARGNATIEEAEANLRSSAKRRRFAPLSSTSTASVPPPAGLSQALSHRASGASSFPRPTESLIGSTSPPSLSAAAAIERDTTDDGMTLPGVAASFTKLFDTYNSEGGVESDEAEEYQEQLLEVGMETESNHSPRTSRFQFPSVKLLFEGNSLTLPTALLERLQPSNKWPPAKGRQVPQLDSRPSAAASTSSPNIEAVEPGTNSCISAFQAFIRFLHNVPNKPDMAKAALTPALHIVKKVPELSAVHVTTDGSALLRAVSTSRAVAVSTHKEQEAVGHMGPGVYAALLVDENDQVLGVYVGVGKVLSLRVSSHETSALLARRLPWSQLRGQLAVQHVHKTAAANGTRLLLVAVAKPPVDLLPLYEAFFIASLGSYTHPAWTLARDLFFPFQPLAHGLNLTPAGKGLAASTSAKTMLRYAIARMARREAVKARGDSNLLAAFDSIQRRHARQVQDASGSIPVIVGFGEEDAHPSYFASPSGSYIHAMTNPMEIALLQQLANPAPSPSSSTSTPSVAASGYDVSIKRHDRQHTRTELRAKLCAGGLLRDTCTVAEIVIADGAGATFAPLVERPELNGLGLQLVVRDEIQTARVWVTTGQQRQVKGLQMLADDTWAMLTEQQQQSRTALINDDERLRRRIASKLPPSAGRWLTGVVVTIPPDDRTPSPFLNVSTSLISADAHPAALAYDVVADAALSSPVSAFPARTVGSIRVRKPEASWPAQNDLSISGGSERFIHIPLEVRMGSDAAWQPFRARAVYELKHLQLSEIWEPAASAIAALADELGFPAPVTNGEIKGEGKLYLIDNHGQPALTVRLPRKGPVLALGDEHRRALRLKLDACRLPSKAELLGAVSFRVRDRGRWDSSSIELRTTGDWTAVRGPAAGHSWDAKSVWVKWYAKMKSSIGSQ